jgi:hypothetical protein
MELAQYCILRSGLHAVRCPNSLSKVAYVVRTNIVLQRVRQVLD